MPTITESLTAVAEYDSLTEAHLTSYREIQLHVEDGQNGIDVVYTLEQAEALHRALGHLLYLANQD